MARIAIVGSGIVGQASGKGLLEWGHEVVFSDISAVVLKALAAEGYEVKKPSELVGSGTTISMMCVSTPTSNGQPDLHFLESAAADLGQRLSKEDGYHLAVVRSTVPPGTTQEMVLQKIEEFSGKEAGKDFGLCMNPEFLREVSAEEDFLHPWIIVIGAIDNRSAETLREVYKTGSVPMVTTDLCTAETIKYAHNLFNATKISFTNEMWLVCERMGIDGNEVMEAVSQSAEGMWNPKYGIKGGYPFEGSCLPKDIRAFLSFAKEHGWELPLLSAVIEVNERMKKESNP
jgi:UDPglucose 6-dehydrogenase